MMNLVFYLLFLMISKNDLFGSVSFILFLVAGSFCFYLIDRDRK